MTYHAGVACTVPAGMIGHADTMQSFHVHKQDDLRLHCVMQRTKLTVVEVEYVLERTCKSSTD
jgi:hypothetical protein